MENAYFAWLSLCLYSCLFSPLPRKLGEAGCGASPQQCVVLISVTRLSSNLEGFPKIGYLLSLLPPPPDGFIILLFP